ncbi:MULTISPECIES: low molecular weight protein-tyrosine-phosphatase [unclassified Hwanghaeella]|uniref:low molecular weight protein-tyrosine-phosphatase n=1 Tax=unclassified Hwanghaeella TaxID=2605944 RepID=UPI000C9209FA|nr:phosphotyrosine protein phosphatase [Rhodospirillales bacterium]HBR83518.1 phosphotyrosine protein phosphatase [Erythrobacter sp.]
MTKTKPHRVLMVCTGNICRSPSAEVVLRHMAEDAGLGDRISVDSAGTADWHTGESPSRLAVVAGQARGYDFNGVKARPLQATDYQEFDLILAMDEGHHAILMKACPNTAHHKIKMFLERAPQAGRVDVPDPYYGDITDYEYALDLIEMGCRGWVSHLQGTA